jgi:hypothetical protein
VHLVDILKKYDVCLEMQREKQRLLAEEPDEHSGERRRSMGEKEVLAESTEAFEETLSEMVKELGGTAFGIHPAPAPLRCLVDRPSLMYARRWDFDGGDRQRVRRTGGNNR